MLRKMLVASFTLAICVGLGLAGEFRNAVITKVDGNKVTFHTTKKKEKGPDMTLPTASGVTVSKGKFNKETKSLEAAGELPQGLNNKMFTDIGEKGVRASITTNEKNEITSIVVVGAKKKKKNQ